MAVDVLAQIGKRLGRIALVVAAEADDHALGARRTAIGIGKILRRDADLRDGHALGPGHANANGDGIAQDQTVEHLDSLYRAMT